jgi:hypothetical protein
LCKARSRWRHKSASSRLAHLEHVDSADDRPCGPASAERGPALVRARAAGAPLPSSLVQSPDAGRVRANARWSPTDRHPARVRPAEPGWVQTATIPRGTRSRSDHQAEIGRTDASSRRRSGPVRLHAGEGSFIRAFGARSSRTWIDCGLGQLAAPCKTRSGRVLLEMLRSQSTCDGVWSPSCR